MVAGRDTGDGSGLRPLATHYQRTDIDWSPDSTAIAFLSTPRTRFVGQDSIVCGTPLSAGSYIVKADGSGLAKIAELPENPSGAYDYASERSWSPDGTRILAVNRQTYPDSIWLLRRQPCLNQRSAGPAHGVSLPA